jgi:hypothetical protein
VRLIAEAVPKRILDQMNVEGLTRENVASHLQVPPPPFPPLLTSQAFKGTHCVLPAIVMTIKTRSRAASIRFEQLRELPS